MLYWLEQLFPKTLSVYKSEYHGEVRVSSFLGEIEVKAGGLTQSGGLVTKIWRQVFANREIVDIVDKSESILILGFGAASVAKVLRVINDSCYIIGIDIEPLMFELAKKYFNFEEDKITKLIGVDAFDWLKNNSSRHDLIVVDLYVGKVIPNKLYRSGFIDLLIKRLKRPGIAIINHTLMPGQKARANQLNKLLSGRFKRVEKIKTVANWVFICFNY